ncbi:amino acid ABC transporter [Defluviimonas sp. 20V17]|uniref:Amino acid/amide ABC transporter membrane protein 2, HAAT family n=1 Tax=Allgaiera indica TaxID=765699 RepID=A0AAN5A1T7_9RHOB|nr:branched-chain amino acid ABC transporter permease [Allgaiera indica]KDB04488.1 amino acid ABC transporter [Defluviimonas sp. 20V17]GHE06114.1 branched-chain amino acid ABC transporter permease [Allgaiera indica]SDX86210.1 amino acid/amide ABC transporter membrane protein 2, HAAT family [Allgaiera indica]
MRETWFKRARAGVITAAVLALVFGFAPTLYNNSSLLFMMMTYIVLAQGLNLLYGFTGYLPFGYVGFFGTGAYATALLVMKLHLPIALAIAAGPVASMVVAVVLGPLLRLSGAYFSIANLAASQILFIVIGNPNMQDITGGPYGVKIDQVYNPTASYAAMVMLVVGVTLIATFFRRSRFGQGLKAMADDPVSAEMSAIPVVRMRLLAWLTSAAVAGLAGALYAWNLSVFYPDAVFTLEISVFAIVFALFGGVGTVLGPIIGAGLLYALYNAIGISEPQYFQLIYGVLIVGLVMFLPEGILSLLTRRGINVF